MFNEIPSDEIINKTVEGLKANGIDAVVVANGAEAKQKLLAMIPDGAEVMNNTSVTLDTISASETILKSGKYIPARNVLYDEKATPKQKAVAGATAEWSLGSVHAITHDGTLIIASNTGSQLPSYAYASPNVVFVAGAQKIVKDREEGFKRIYEYVLPQESERARKAYGVAGSNVSKMLIISKEINPNRIKLILIKEAIGF